MQQLFTACFFYALIAFQFGLTQSFDYQFKGTIDIQEVGAFDYSLNFNIDEKGGVQGVSISDVGGTFETQSKIEGTVDSTTQLFRFREVSVIKSSVQQDEYELCLVQSEAVDFEAVKSGESINCKFSGRLVNGKQCGTGFLQLKLSKPIPQKDVNRPAIVFEGPKNLSLNWEDKSFVLEVWDNNREDGDSIQVIVNGQVMSSIEITKTPQVFSYSISKGTTQITIRALNEGEATYNTLIGKLIDGNSTTPFSSKLLAGEEIQLNLIH